MAPEVHILSYFSIETDLVAEFRGWPEFQSGSDYNVELASAEASVSISLVAASDEEPAYVRVRGSAGGQLFDRALGRTAHALGAHSDYVWLDRLS